MSQTFLSYLNREHQRLEQELAELERQRFPDQTQMARIKKLKLGVKDRIALIEQRAEAADAA